MTFISPIFYVNTMCCCWAPAHLMPCAKCCYFFVVAVNPTPSEFFSVPYLLARLAFEWSGWVIFLKHIHSSFRRNTIFSEPKFNWISNKIWIHVTFKKLLSEMSCFWSEFSSNRLNYLFRKYEIKSKIRFELHYTLKVNINITCFHVSWNSSENFQNFFQKNKEKIIFLRNRFSIAFNTKLIIT